MVLSWATSEQGLCIHFLYQKALSDPYIKAHYTKYAQIILSYSERVGLHDLKK